MTDDAVEKHIEQAITDILSCGFTVDTSALTFEIMPEESPRSLGYFKPNTTQKNLRGKIVINPLLTVEGAEDILNPVLLHEICHYLVFNEC